MALKVNAYYFYLFREFCNHLAAGTTGSHWLFGVCHYYNSPK